VLGAGNALRFASPALSRGLRALTAPARNSPIGRYVMGWRRERAAADSGMANLDHRHS